MFNTKEGKPVDITIVESTYINGELAEKGTELKAVPVELAMELAAAGKCRPTSAVPAAKKSGKAE